MANTMAFTFSVIENGSRNLVLQVIGVDTTTTVAWTQDGSSTAIFATNVSGFTPGVHLKIRRIIYNTTGCMARLQWHQTSNAEALNLSGYGTMDLRDTQGIINAGGAGSTGDIDLTSIATSANTAGTVTAAMTLIIECIKGV